MLSRLERARLWLRSALLRRRLEREMQEEMAEHLRRSTERLTARGLSTEEARRQAEREFGNVPYLQEEARDARGTAWLDALRGDLRFALRHFARTPLTTATMLIVLAIGMSISALLFSYVHSYATSPPPGIERTDDLVRIRGGHTVQGGRMYRTFDEAELQAYFALRSHFAAVAGWADELVRVDAASGDDGSEEARAAFVTDEYLRVLGVQPSVGRALPASAFTNPAEAAVVVINHAMWEALFGGDPGVIGRTLHVNGVPVTIVGVAPEQFRGVGGFSRFHLWLPLQAHGLLIPDPPQSFRAAARLADGVSLQEATAAVAVVAGRSSESETQARVVDPTSDVVPLLAANGDPMFERDVRLMALAVGLLALLVLLVACTNVSALLTGLATARRHEIAVRLSLGAARPRLLRQLLTESALLAVAAATAALFVVGSVLSLVNRYIYALPLSLGVNWPLTLFTFGVALTVGVAFGLSPALHATRLALASVMRDSAANVAAKRGRLQRGLVVAQIAFTQPLMVLITALLLFVVTDVRPRRPPGLAEQLVNVSLHSTQLARSDDDARARVRRAVDEVASHVAALPGVQRMVLDWGGDEELGTYATDPVAGVTSDPVRLDPFYTEPGYFDMLQVPLVRGRDFTSEEILRADAAEVPVIIDVDLARRVWGSSDPIGRRLTAVSDSARIRELRVVGVVVDPRAAARRHDQPHAVFLPRDTSFVATAILARTAGPGEALLPAIRQIVIRHTPTGMVARVRTLAEINEDHERRFRIVVGSVSVAGLMALLLSAIGLYAVVAFAVTQRTREIAVRMAIGGRSGSIVRGFVADGLRLSAVGLLFGLPLSLLGLRALMTVQDAPQVALEHVTILAALGVVTVATLAAWIPARRAAAVEPAEILRSE